MKEYSEVYAVDFDKTINLAETYPQLGKPNTKLIEFLKERQQEGDKIILWTCREGDELKSAVKYCAKHGLKFDAVNDNLQAHRDFFGNNSRKVYAHHYIDDKNLYLFGIGKEIQEKRVESMKEVDFSGLTMPCVAVYKNPADFPEDCVARIYELARPTDTIMVKKTMGEIQKDIQKHTRMTFYPRGKDDVPTLVGVWM